MFFSKTFLARKGALGTVWSAAHLHHKLNKSHYISTNIITTVERIMYPEVPIALRMSSHLLLGVVRIYSKQVEYFFQDCNILLIGIRKAFASTDVNLPETATIATFESVTLLDKFQLDAMDLDTDFSEMSQDSHIKDPKEISIEDQILLGQDPYIVVSFDEDVRNSPCSRVFSGCRPQPMQEDNCLYTPVGATIASLDPGPSNQERVGLSTDTNGLQSYPEIEMRCDASRQYFSENDPFWPDQSEDRLEPDLVLVEILKQKETDSYRSNCLYTPVGATIAALDPGPSNQERVGLSTDTNELQSYPEIEMRCDASRQYFSENDPFWPDQSEDRLEQDLVLVEILKQKETDSSSCTPVGATIGALNPGPSNQERVGLSTDNNGPRSYPEIEMMCDASRLHFSENDLFWPDQSEDRLEPDMVLLEYLKQKQTDSLAVELVPEVSPLPLEQHKEPNSVVSKQGPEILNSNKAYGQVSPKLAIRSTPQAQQPMRKQRRRHNYDDITVLSNRFMNQQMNDSSCILRKRKECPTDPLDNSKLNKRIKKDTIFFEPLLTGLCSDLCDAYKKDFISVKPYLTIVKEACPPPQYAEISTPVNVDEIETESLRHRELPAGNNSLPELVRSPNIVLSSPARLTPSPTREHNCTPAFGNDTSPLLDLEETAYGGTSNLAAFTGTPRSDKVTPMLFSKDQPGVEDTFCTDIPELRNTVDGDLSFLAEDDNNLSGPQETPNCFLRKHSGRSEIEHLSARTRYVAQFLKIRSSGTPAAESQSVDVSLKTILEGKRRKVCARMVFETLVLKNYGLVDVHQEESFGDIILTVTQKLSKKLFST
ncbi:hypothetical protein POM88_053361 [Heracleum sosnowskyi]|uniref:Sister chromatid cohesion 1 protein 3 n=1 Tax=Heracleum sosnowskyi TaxID=360622 RepID=A0AAD8GQ75_9APIA|nr:hypothetical protein POM88_053361 [Heracleum sosnowskyi]